MHGCAKHGGIIVRYIVILVRFIVDIFLQCRPLLFTAVKIYIFERGTTEEGMTAIKIIVFEHRALHLFQT